MKVIIRLARSSDAEAMLGIYAPLVRETPVSFEVTPPTIDEYRERIIQTVARMPWLVCDVDGCVAGFTYAAAYRTRAAYQWTAESAVYVDAEYRGKGVGCALYRALLDTLRRQGFHSVVAAIALPNPASEGLHERFRFKRAGVLRAVGHKLGAWHDVARWQLSLADPVPSPPPPQPLSALADSPQWHSLLIDAASLVTL